MEENILEQEQEREESIYDKLQGMLAEMHQMERMIEENTQKIAEGDDVEGRTYLKEHLEIEVLKRKSEIAKLKKQIAAEVEELSL